MAKKPDDGIVIWKESDRSFLPKNISKDKLATFIKLLVGQVKEDHARHGYKKDVRDYGAQITQIIHVAVHNGYKLQEFDPDETEKPSQENDGIDWDNIVDA